MAIVCRKEYWKRECFTKREFQRGIEYLSIHTHVRKLSNVREKKNPAKGQKRIASGVHRGPKVVPVPNSHCGTLYNSWCIELESKSVEDSERFCFSIEV